MRHRINEGQSSVKFFSRHHIRSSTSNAAVSRNHECLPDTKLSFPRDLHFDSSGSKPGRPFYQITFSSLFRKLFCLVPAWRKVNATLPVHLPLRQANFSGYVRARTSAGKPEKAGRERSYSLAHLNAASFDSSCAYVRLPLVGCASLKRMFRLSAA
jgi:hypothetical protein